MTAPTPAETGQEQQQPRKPGVRHKLCATEALRARDGLPRVTLCGKVKSGPRGQILPSYVPCPLCFDAVSEHRASCPACQAAGWGG